MKCMAVVTMQMTNSNTSRASITNRSKSLKAIGAGTSENWIDVAIEKNEGTVEVLPGPLATQYNSAEREPPDSSS